MLRLDNTTPFTALTCTFPDLRGADCLHVFVKGGFRIAENWPLLAEQPPMQAEDLYLAEPGASSLLFPSDIHIGKPSTDVLLVGSACAPEGELVHAMDVRLCIESREKLLRVNGDRVWQNGRPSPPQPFSEMPIVYERAFGGCLPSEKGIQAIEENPIGTGFRGQRKAEEMEGLPLPNIENPAAPVLELDDTPAPVGFGAIAPQWLPRRQFAGTYDELWQQTRAPLLPLDFDSRFCHSAPEDQIWSEYMQGGEHFLIEGMHPHGPIQFSLPQIRLRCVVVFEGREQECALKLETVLVKPKQLELTLNWKGLFHCDKKTNLVESILLDTL